MSFSNYIRSKLNFFIKKILKFNSIELHEGNFIDKESTIIESEIKGKVNVSNNTSISQSKISGEVNIGSQTIISNAKLIGKIKTGFNVKLIDGVELYGQIEIGNFTSINGPNTDLRCLINKITIGNFCSIARNVTFQEYNHDFSQLTSYFVHTNLENKPMRTDVISKGDIVLGHDVWIGTHCVILSGSSIGTGAVIAANSVVAGNIPPYAIAAGSPAKVIKYRFDEKTINDLLKSNWWHKEKSEILEMFNNFKKNKS